MIIEFWAWSIGGGGGGWGVYPPPLFLFYEKRAIDIICTQQPWLNVRTSKTKIHGVQNFLAPDREKMGGGGGGQGSVLWWGRVPVGRHELQTPAVIGRGFPGSKRSHVWISVLSTCSAIVFWKEGLLKWWTESLCKHVSKNYWYEASQPVNQTHRVQHAIRKSAVCPQKKIQGSSWALPPHTWLRGQVIQTCNTYPNSAGKYLQTTI